MGVWIQNFIAAMVAAFGEVIHNIVRGLLAALGLGG